MHKAENPIFAEFFEFPWKLNWEGGGGGDGGGGGGGGGGEGAPPAMFDNKQILNNILLRPGQHDSVNEPQQLFLKNPKLIVE